ncbi:amidohydrolase family protein [Pseudofrankia inefficax]|uniref:Amidohydrolase n=1 Tax=Pseudofrankia inefficax (strain DSM 45817 / CECT 9037 / DDB 130130 / EuI1c) TaxID=298654 RepID=E3J4Z8_PSEI1|nr:amidohydrolase family protein [Pseudofrankia inefficax]ADP79449.1 amidohydrolase [Pseudofrankia inefficax]
MPERVLVRGGTVLTMERGAAPLRADVLVEDGLIVAVAPDLAAADADVVEADRCLVLPGMVDTHRHVWQTQLRGVTHDWSLKDYIRSVRFTAAACYRPEDMYVGNYLGMLEAIDAGITTVLDFSHCINTPEHADAALNGTRDAGIRSVFALGLNDVPVPDIHFSTLAQRIEHARALRHGELKSDSALVTMGISLSDVLVAGIGRVTEEVAVSRDLGLPITLHANAVMFPTPVSEVGFLDEAGLLGPDLVWVHMNQTTDDELRRVLDTGGAISTTPETEMQMGMGHPVHGRFMALGGRCTFGCDVISNNSGDLFPQVRLALQTERMLRNDRELDRRHGPDDIGPSTLSHLEGATVNGAEALGLGSRIGTLTPGKEADLIVVRGDAPNMIPVNDPVSALVLHAHAGNVDTVMVAGRILKRDGRLLADAARRLALMDASHGFLRDAIEARGGLIPQPPAPLPW